MTASLERGREMAQREYSVERLTECDHIRALLAPERAYAAYAIAQLEPRLFAEAEWYRATGTSGHAVVLHSRSGLGRALFASGDHEALDAILGLHPGPGLSFGSLRPEHRHVVEKYFIFTRPQTMLRMSVSTAAFKPVEGKAVRLRGRDVPAINRLYSSEGGPTTYSPHHIEDGVYCGVFAEGALVSIAGTHVVSETEGVAVVGNVFTHRRYRGRGLGTVATSATTTALLDRCPLVVLTVETRNDSAISIYRHLGYETQCTLHETPLVRKEPIGALSLARRVIAVWRGRAEGKEIVVR